MHPCYNLCIMGRRPGSTTADVLERRTKVADLWATRPDRSWIAEQVGVSVTTVLRDCREMGLEKPNRILPETQQAIKDLENAPYYLAGKAMRLMEVWKVKAETDPAAVRAFVQVADLYAKIAGAYAPEKRLNANVNLKPPEPVAIPADVIEATGEIVKELEIDSSK